MARAAEIGEGQHSHAGLHVEAPRHFGGVDGDFGQILGGGFDVDGGIRQEINIALGSDHHINAGNPAHAVPHFDDLQGGTDHFRIMLSEAADHGVGVAQAHHHGAEDVAVENQFPGFAACDALALAEAVHLFGIGRQPLRLGRIDDPQAVEAQSQVGHRGANPRRIAEQNRVGDLLIHQDLASAQDLGLLAFGEDHPFGLALGFVNHDPHHFVGLAQAALELLTVFAKIDGGLGHTGFHGGLRHGRRLPNEHARIERLGNDVLATEFQTIDAVGAAHIVGHILARQGRQGAGGGQLHLVVDDSGTDVQRAAEDEGESQDVVDLIGIVGASGGHDGVGAGGHGYVVGDLRIGIRQRKDNGIVRHGQQHVRRDRVAARQAEEHVRAYKSVGQSARFGIGGEALLIGIHAFLAAFVDDTLGVAHEDVFAAHAQVHIMLRAGDAGGARAVEDHAYVADAFAGQVQGVQQRGAGDDGGAVLIVVEDGNLHGAAAFFLDVEAFGRLDILQIDAAEGGLEHLAGADDFVGVGSGQFDIEDVDIGEALEQDGLAFHYGLAGGGADVAESEDSGAVGDDGNEITFAGVLIDQAGVAGDFEARHGHTGGVGQAQVALGEAGVGGDYGDFAGGLGGVIGEGFLGIDVHRGTLGTGLL